MGFRGKHKNKRDANEPDIFDALRGHGFTVCPLDKPCDAVVGYQGRSYLVEVKMPKGKLTGPQEQFLEMWRGDFTILRSIDEATEFASKIRAIS